MEGGIVVEEVEGEVGEARGLALGGLVVPNDAELAGHGWGAVRVFDGYPAVQIHPRVDHLLSK